MKTLTTTYKKTEHGLILKNNYVSEMMEYDLKEFLMSYFDDLEELNHETDNIKESLKFRGYSSIIEGVMKDGTVIHIRFVK